SGRQQSYECSTCVSRFEVATIDLGYGMAMLWLWVDWLASAFISSLLTKGEYFSAYYSTSIPIGDFGI
ncbi:MAG: hypothetical protein RML75_11165, partial [Cyanobacteriota bacterium SKYGB_h_bin112]|nr:hypothetical protein [Cyanobacteriota bacterium SKYGB_h_bin112]